MKKFICLLMTVILMLSMFCACGTKTSTSTSTITTTAPAETVPAVQEVAPTATTQEYTDDVGRTVAIPTEIKKIAISGPLTQVYVLPIASDMLVGSATEFSKDAEKYLGKDVVNMPQLGQLYGGKGTMDLEGLLKAAPDIVLDVGEAKKTMSDDFDALTKQTGIPFVHIDATVGTAADAYRKIGKLLGREQKGEELASFLEGIYDDMAAMMQKVDADGKRKSIIYCLGDDGLHVLADGSYHAETLKYVANNIAQADEIVPSGQGNEVDLEQIMLWNPDVIIFENNNCYNNAESSDAWKSLSALKNGTYYQVPCGPYGWMASPPSVQRYLGLIWLGSVLYPDYCTFSLQDKVTEFYKLFYNYELTDEEFISLTENSLGK